MTSSAFRIIVRTGPNPGTVTELTKEVSLIGRDVTNDVVIGDAEVSRQHARVTRTPGGYVLEDLGSTNGTFVNSERLTTPRVLNPGDLIALGETVTLTFDAVSPEVAATVASPAAGSAATVRDAQAPAAPQVGQPGSPQPVAPAVAPEKKRRSPWMLAGIGCFVLIIACGGFLWFMDAFYPDILYYPLRLLGFY
jgi:predicted component of type VI protein secretion system